MRRGVTIGTIPARKTTEKVGITSPEGQIRLRKLQKIFLSINKTIDYSIFKSYNVITIWQLFHPASVYSTIQRAGCSVC